MEFHTIETYWSLVLTGVKYNINELPIVEEENIVFRIKSNFLMD